MNLSNIEKLDAKTNYILTNLFKYELVVGINSELMAKFPELLTGFKFDQVNGCDGWYKGYLVISESTIHCFSVYGEEKLISTNIPSEHNMFVKNLTDYEKAMIDIAKKNNKLLHLLTKELLKSNIKIGNDEIDTLKYDGEM